MNPAFKRLFLCSDAILGKPISYLIDPEPFETLKNQEVELVERTVNYKSYSLICRQLCYFLAEENQFVGIFVNITKLQESKKELEIIREKTIEEAKNLLHHQVTMAQKMAKFLGEHTAIGEELVENLMRFVETKKNSNFDDLPPL
jgi:hypothetical protein